MTEITIAETLQERFSYTRELLESIFAYIQMPYKLAYVELGVGDRVVGLGHLPFAEMERQFESAWVQMVPSRWEEPFGNVSTEAMMRGTAVIASAVGGQPEIVQDGVTEFLVAPGDVQAIATPLLRLLRDRNLAEQMGQAGRQRALTRFGESQHTDRFIDLYQQIRASYPAPSFHATTLAQAE